MKIVVELGNIWEMLSAIGTIAAVGVALWLARREGKIRANFHVEGLDTPKYIYENEFTEKSKIISFEFYNLGNYKMTITSISAIYLKKPAIFFLKKIYLKRLKKRVKFKESIFLMEPRLRRYSKLPLNIEAKSNASFYFFFENFLTDLPNNKKQHIVFIARDSMGNEYYDYKEIPSKRVEQFLKEKE